MNYQQSSQRSSAAQAQSSALMAQPQRLTETASAMDRLDALAVRVATVALELESRLGNYMSGPHLTDASAKENSPPRCAFAERMHGIANVLDGCDQTLTTILARLEV